MTPDKMREAFKKWLEANGLSAHSAAKKAGISPGAIYNFLNGTSDSLSSVVLQKLAQSTGKSVDAILHGTAGASQITVAFRIGANGRIFKLDDTDDTTIPRPAGIPQEERISAAIVDGDGLLPIPAGWIAFFRSAQEAPERLIGKMAVVRYSGGGDRPVVRTIRRGTQAGLFTLTAFSGAVIEDVEILAAHRVISFSQPEE